MSAGLCRQIWQCAWCRRYFDDASSVFATLPAGVPAPLSHGICPDCFKVQVGFAYTPERSPVEATQ